jgi:hypothetical protein
MKSLQDVGLTVLSWGMGALAHFCLLIPQNQEVGNKSSEETAQRQAVWRQGWNAVKVQMESLMLDLSKITKVERIEEMVLVHIWPSGVKALLDTNSYF